MQRILRVLTAQLAALALCPSFAAADGPSIRLSQPAKAILRPPDGRDPIATDRPDFTETTDTVPLGMIQLEGGYTLSRFGPDREHSFGELLFRIATGRRTEARIALNSYVWTEGMGSARGIEDATLGMKVRLCDGVEEFNLLHPAASLILESNIPTGSRDFNACEPQPGAKLLLGWDLNARWSLASNLNYSYAIDGGSRFHQFSGSVSAAVSINDRLGAYFETYGIVPTGYRAADAHYINAGLTYLVNPDFQLDFRVGKNIATGQRDEFIGVGAARRW